MAVSIIYQKLRYCSPGITDVAASLMAIFSLSFIPAGAKMSLPDGISKTHLIHAGFDSPPTRYTQYYYTAGSFAWHLEGK